MLMQKRFTDPLTKSSLAVKRRITQEPSWINGWCDSFLARTEDKFSSDKEDEGHDKDTRSSVLSFLASLKSCAKSKDLCEGTRLHADIRHSGLLEKNTNLGNTLISMYAKCGALTEAQQAFHELPVRDVVSWNALISGYAQNRRGQEALDCYQQMQGEGISPDVFTYACILKACGIIGAVDRGRQIHNEISCQGLLRRDVVLGTSLVDMYAKCGALKKAQQVLEELPRQDVVSWTALVAGYAQNGQGEEALDCYNRMRRAGFSPDAITYACILKACGITGAVDRGKQIHDEIASKGLLRKVAVLDTALLDMYAKCGALKKAQEVFDELIVQDLVAWSSLITGFAQHGHGEEALNCYDLMRHKGYSPDDITYTSILKACGNIGAIDRGRQIHREIIGQGLLEKNFVLGNALIDMYAKCGVLSKAEQVFDELPSRNLVSWSALMASYAQQGQSREALNSFLWMRGEGFTPNIVSWNALIGGFAQQGQVEEALGCLQWMQQESISPDAITFVCVLHACSHSGLVDEGQMVFETMSKAHGITPNLEHLNCLVDLFGRAGFFDRAMAVISRMPSSDCPRLWCTLLGACQKWGNVKLGRLAFEHAVKLDDCDTATFISMKNIYAAAGMDGDDR